MKKIILCILLMLISVLMNAQDFFVSEQIQFASSYIYQGKHYGAFSIQPSITLHYQHFYFNTWFNIGSTSYKNFNDAAEINIKAGYNNYGLKIEYKHISMLNEKDAFIYNKSQAVGLIDIDYDLSHFTNIPISFGAYTKVAGRKYDGITTYFELSTFYDFAYNYHVKGCIGLHTNYDIVATMSIEAYISKLLYDGQFTYELYAHGMINPIGINRSNYITYDSDQHLNACIGIIISSK